MRHQYLFATLLMASTAYANYLDLSAGYKSAFFERDAKIIQLSDNSLRSLKIKFSDLSIATLDGKAQFFLTPCCYLRAKGEYGWIIDGDTRRTTDAPTQQAALNGTYQNEGHVADLQGAIGYKLLSYHCLDVAPVVGIGYNHQAFSSQQNNRTIFSNKLTWIGPWAGVDLCYQPTCSFFFNLEYAFHWVRYRDYHVDIPFGAAFIDFIYKNARGHTVLLEGTYLSHQGYRWGLGLTFEEWQSIGKPEISAIALTPFPLSLVAETDQWLSWGIQFRLGKEF